MVVTVLLYATVVGSCVKNEKVKEKGSRLKDW